VGFYHFILKTPNRTTADEDGELEASPPFVRCARRPVSYVTSETFGRGRTKQLKEASSRLLAKAKWVSRAGAAPS
jgi:hypothetical protein